MTVPARKVRAARTYLRRHLKAKSSEISPRRFAAASHESGSDFHQLIQLIARMYAGGQNEQAQRAENIRSIASGGG